MEDKDLHAKAGILIALVGWVATKFMKISYLYAVILAIFIGLAKEIVWDKWMGMGMCELMDFVYTSVAGVCVIVFIRICIRTKQKRSLNL
jgi:hypothetical protein